jgi:hypothetical protein
MSGENLSAWAIRPRAVIVIERIYRAQTEDCGLSGPRRGGSNHGGGLRASVRRSSPGGMRRRRVGV